MFLLRMAAKRFQFCIYVTCSHGNAEHFLVAVSCYHGGAKDSALAVC